MPIYTTKGTTAVALLAATAKSVGSIITPSTRRAKLRRVTVGCLSVTAADVAGTLEIVQFDSDGTGTAVTPTPDDTAETAALLTSKTNYTVEPTTNAVVKSILAFSPQGVTIEKRWDPGAELLCPISKLLAIRITMPQAQSIWWEAEYEE